MTAINTNTAERERSFPIALWGTGVALRVVVVAIMLALNLFQPLSITILAVVFGIDFLIFIWQFVRYSNIASTHLHQTGRFGIVALGYGVFVAFMIAMVAVWFLLYSETSASEFDRTRDKAMAESEKLPAERFFMEISDDQRTLSFEGVLAQGMMQEIDKELARNPQVREITLNSPGGNLFEAREFARRVREKGLSTYVTNECSASCTLVFAAGAPRNLGRGARLGFHRYGLDFKQVLSHVSPLQEMETDRAFLERRNIDPDFLDKVFDLSRSALWYPSRQELFDAGVISAR